jgi:hypothetical protein
VTDTTEPYDHDPNYDPAAARKAEKHEAFVAEYQTRYGGAGRDAESVARVFGLEGEPPSNEVEVDPDAESSPNVGHK